MLFKVKFASYDSPRLVALEKLPMSCGCEGTLDEWLSNSFAESQGLNREEEDALVIEWKREYRERVQVGTVTLRLVRDWRVYGGPEEGGWYYSSYELEREFTVPSRTARRHKERLERYAERCNEDIRGGGCEGKWAVFTGAWTPRRRPHYC